MRRSTGIFSLAAALLLGLAMESHAQTYNINWYKIAGGGGTSTNGSYSLSGTIGQPDAGTMAGGAYSLTGGFWGMIAVVQTPGSPFLTIKAGPSKNVILSWPASANGFVPQQNSAANSPSWSNVNTNTYPITVSNGTNYITL